MNVVVARAFAHGDEAGHAAAGDEFAADEVAGAFGGDEQCIDAGGRFDEAEVDVEAVRAHEDVAGLQVRLDFLFVEVALQLVGDEDVDDVGLLWRRRRRSSA